MKDDITLYAIVSPENEVIKTSYGKYYFTRAVARKARKEIKTKARIAKCLFLSAGKWETSK
jgi:hypothetical protein